MQTYKHHKPIYTPVKELFFKIAQQTTRFINQFYFRVYILCPQHDQYTYCTILLAHGKIKLVSNHSISLQFYSKCSRGR